MSVLQAPRRINMLFNKFVWDYESKYMVTLPYILYFVVNYGTGNDKPGNLLSLGYFMLNSQKLFKLSF